MPFPSTLEALYRAGYVFLRLDKCSECGGGVHVFKTPGGREIVMEPNFDTLSPATRHYERCNIASQAQKPPQHADAPKPSPQPQRQQETASAPQQIKLYGVTDRNMIAVGWLDGTLAIQFRYGRYHYANVPEDVFTKIRNNPFPNNMFVKLVKNHPELYPYTKVS